MGGCTAIWELGGRHEDPYRSLANQRGEFREIPPQKIKQQRKDSKCQPQIYTQTLTGVHSHTQPHNTLHILFSSGNQLISPPEIRILGNTWPKHLQTATFNLYIRKNQLPIPFTPSHIFKVQETLKEKAEEKNRLLSAETNEHVYAWSDISKDSHQQYKTASIKDRHEKVSHVYLSAMETENLKFQASLRYTGKEGKEYQITTLEGWKKKKSLNRVTY